MGYLRHGYGQALFHAIRAEIQAYNVQGLRNKEATDWAERHASYQRIQAWLVRAQELHPGAPHMFTEVYPWGQDDVMPTKSEVKVEVEVEVKEEKPEQQRQATHVVSHNITFQKTSPGLGKRTLFYANGLNVGGDEPTGEPFTIQKWRRGADKKAVAITIPETPVTLPATPATPPG